MGLKKSIWNIGIFKPFRSDLGHLKNMGRLQPIAKKYKHRGNISNDTIDLVTAESIETHREIY